MALTTFMDTVSGRFTELSAQLRPHLGYLSAVYRNPIDPQPVSPYSKVKIPLASVDGSVVNALTGAPGINAIATTATEVELDNLATKPFALNSYDATRVSDSPALLDEALEATMIQMLESINAAIAAKFLIATYSTTGNTSSSVVNTNPAKITYDEFVTLRKVLSTRKIPISDFGKMFMVCHSEIYHNMMKDDDFITTTYAGDQPTSDLRRTGALPPIHGIIPIEDPQSVVSGTDPNFTYSTAMFHQKACILAAGKLAPPMDNANWRYVDLMGLPVLLTFRHDENLAASGGPSNIVIPRILYTVKEHRIDHCVIHRSILAAS